MDYTISRRELKIPARFVLVYGSFDSRGDVEYDE